MGNWIGSVWTGNRQKMATEMFSQQMDGDGQPIGIGLSMVLLVVGKPFMLSENVSLTAPMLVKPGLFISALIFTFLLNILSAGIPAWRTTRQPIVEALKGNE